MKLVSFRLPEDPSPVPQDRIGVLLGERVLDLETASGGSIKGGMRAFLDGGPRLWNIAREAAARDSAGALDGVALKDVRLRAPLPDPPSLKDFFAFEAHAKAGAKRRGETLPEEWYEIPAYYKGNHREVYGPDEEIPWPAYTRKLDFECEIACVVGRPGRDVSPEEAEDHIFGYMIFNDFSARDIQKKERALGMGPAKGKDFANAFGPWLVTADEVDPAKDLRMKGYVNGELWAEGDFKDQHWGFPLLLSHVSQEETLHPGDVFGSGCFHGGCGMDLERWIQPGDLVELEVPLLGRLRNRIGRPKEQVRLDYRKNGQDTQEG